MFSIFKRIFTRSTKPTPDQIPKTRKETIAEIDELILILNKKRQNTQSAYTAPDLFPEENATFTESRNTSVN